MSDSKLAEKLSGQVAAILDQHRATVLPMLGGVGAITRTALENDEAVRTVAGYCYLMLPGLLRLAIKEPAFISFVLSHRERLLGTLVQA